MRLTVEIDDGTGVDRPVVIDVDDDGTIGDVATELAFGCKLFDISAPALRVVGRPSQQLYTDTPIVVADIRSGDRIEVLNGRPGHGNSDAIGAATLVVEAGPETGRRIDLGPGRHFIGRDSNSTITIADPLLSRRHLSVLITDVVEIADEGSTNGIKVDGVVVGQPMVLRGGQRVSAGDTVFRVDQQAGALAEAARGTIQFNRPPRVWKPFAGLEFEVPTPPGPKPKQRIPMVAAMAPLFMGAVMLGVTQAAGGRLQAASFVFMAMSPVMMLASVIEQRKGSRKDHVDQVSLFNRELEVANERLRVLETDERTSREVEAPGVGELAQLVEQTQARLWERSPDDDDFLNLRLGVGELPLRTTLKFTSPKGAHEPSLKSAEQLIESFRQLRSAPVVVELQKVASLGLAGAQTETESVARSLVLQLAALHSPADLVFSALLGPSMQERWRWLLWLPHVETAASPISGNHLPATVDASLEFLEQLAQVVEKRRASASSYGARASQTSIVVFIDETIALDRARLNWLFQLTPDLGVFVVWLGSSISRMPKGCGAVADIPGGGVPGTVGWTSSGQRIDNVRFEGVPEGHANRVARRMAPIVDVTAGASGGGSLPESVSLVDVLGTREVLRDTAPVLENWLNSKSLRAPIGRSGVGAFTIDMRTDGPHALVAGTTGAGKSELLQAFIASLALNHSPKKVTFLLVDYKGGSAFAKCVEFPHTVGLVTDLDTNQVRRALTSLNAELHYRERVLQEHRCKDLIEMEKRGIEQAPPSLLLIVDEFAALAKEIPEFVDGVVNIAQRGRSLGIHLVLATQRPAGVITDNIRANTNLRIALRVADPSESSDVLGTPVAASLSRTTPGRGVAKVGPQELVPFQGGYVGGHSSLEQTTATVRIADRDYGTLTPWPDRGGTKTVDIHAPNDLARMVDVAQRANAALGQGLPRKPWLLPLPAAQDLFALPMSRSDGEIVLGLLDEPAHQTQRPAIWQTDRDGNFAIFGSGGSGKSTALWAIAASVSSAIADTPPMIYALDFAGRSLEAIDPLPSVGSVIASDDHERITRLLTSIRTTISSRSIAFAAVRAGSLSDYRRIVPQKAKNNPRIFVLIDGFGNFLSTYDRIERGIWSELVPKLMAEGRQVGVHFVITTDRRNSMPNSVYSIISQRIVLRMTNDDEYGSLGAPYKVLNSESPAGRALYDGLEMQVGVPGGSLRADEQALGLRKLGAQLQRQQKGFKAPPIGVLEKVVHRVDLGAKRSGAFAVSGATLTPLPLPVEDGVFLIAGPMRSGKTSSLVAIAESLQEADSDRQLFYCSGRRNTASSAAVWSSATTTLEESAALVRQIADDLTQVETTSPPVVFLDDFHETNETDLGQAVSALLKVGREYPVLVIASADSSQARRASQYTPLGELRQHKCGVLLAPDAANSDGDVLGAQLPTTSVRSWPEGRGYLVHRGALELVQIGLPV